LHLPESELPWQASRGYFARDWRSGVSAERRHLKKTGKFAAVCTPLRSRRIVRRPLENSRGWICRTVALRYCRNSTSEFGFIGNRKYLFPKD
jgi:hypothetical protein